MKLRKRELLRAMPYLRNLFRLHGLDVSAYPDEAVADAVLQVCPTITDDWPTDTQLTAVFRQLRSGAKK